MSLVGIANRVELQLYPVVLSFISHILFRDDERSRSPANLNLSRRFFHLYFLLASFLFILLRICILYICIYTTLYSVRHVASSAGSLTGVKDRAPLPSSGPDPLGCSQTPCVALRNPSPQLVFQTLWLALQTPKLAYQTPCLASQTPRMPSLTP